MSHRLQVTLDDEQYEALRAASAATGASLAELVRQAIEHRHLPESDRSARFRAALDDASGVWADRRESGPAYQRRVRASLAQRSTQR